MSPRIDRAASPAVTTPPETEHAPAAASPGPTCSVEQHTLEQAERAYATSTMSPGEAAIAAGAAHLGFHESMEVSGKMLVGAELGARLDGTIKIERRDDGKFEVTAMAAGQVGVGDEKHRLVGGVGAGTTIVVNTPEAAADVAQAMATVGVVATAKSSIALLPWAWAADKLTGTSEHAAERLQHYAASGLKSAGGDVRFSGAAKLHLKEPLGLSTHGEAEFQLSGGLKVDLEKGELIRSGRFELAADARGALNFGPMSSNPEAAKHVSTLSKSLALAAGSAEAEVKGSIRLEQHIKLSPEMIARLKRGELDPEAALEKLKDFKGDWVAVAEFEAEGAVQGLALNGIGRAKVTAEVPVANPKELAQRLASGDIAGAMEPMLKAEWEVEGELGVGNHSAVDAHVAFAETTIARFQKFKSEKGSLEHCIEHSKHQMAHQVALEQQLQAQRAHP